MLISVKPKNPQFEYSIYCNVKLLKKIMNLQLSESIKKLLKKLVPLAELH